MTSNDGTVLENLELRPDVEVDSEYHLVARGRDQQLERAVEELLPEPDPP